MASRLRLCSLVSRACLVGRSSAQAGERLKDSDQLGITLDGPGDQIDLWIKRRIRWAGTDVSILHVSLAEPSAGESARNAARLRRGVDGGGAGIVRVGLGDIAPVEDLALGLEFGLKGRDVARDVPGKRFDLRVELGSDLRLPEGLPGPQQVAEHVQGLWVRGKVATRGDLRAGGVVTGQAKGVRWTGDGFRLCSGALGPPSSPVPSVR